MIAVPMRGGTVPVRWRRDAEDDARERFCLLVGCGRSASALEEALQGEGFRPAAVGSLAAARRELRSWAPDLLVVGEGLDEGDPVACLPTLVAEGSGSTLLFLADRSDPERAGRALENGADDVVVPPHSVSAILLRYHLVGRRLADRRSPRGILPRRVQLGGLEIDLPGRRVLAGDQPSSLSGREFELLTRLLEARGEVVTREALIEDIWGADRGTEAVLDATVHRLRRKLEDDAGDPRLLTTVRGVGYRLEGDGIG